MITSASRRPSRRPPYVEKAAAPTPAEAAGYEHEDEKSLPARPRMGPLKPWERRMLNAKAVCWSVMGLTFMAFVLWASKP